MAKINYVTMANYDEHFQYIMSIDEKRDVGVSQTEQAYDNLNDLLVRGFQGEQITLSGHTTGLEPVFDVIGALDDTDDAFDAADIAEAELDSMPGSEHLSSRQKDVVRSGVQSIHKQSVTDKIKQALSDKFKRKLSKDGNGGEPPEGKSSPPAKDSSK